ncbi:ArsR/SmtB family transcription factor [Streptomyces sp. NBC_01716]|uniref:ArsR/SmtB family transcription factor n=1 Tax=Streptomyces sp. NBC_01716 TaxID=2975917 RepID=UPI002E380AF4|nr:DUF5937 family protein [Streptomyces sp. NBC_01716]
MAFQLHFGERDLLRCRFALSPLWETQEAVRTLARPERHGYHLPWLQRIRAAADGLDLRRLWLVMPRVGHNPDFFCPPPESPVATFTEEIALVRATPPEVAHRDLALALAETPGAAGSDAGREMLADPGRTVREFAGLLEQVWRQLVEPDWPRLRALLEADIAYHSRRLAEVGFGRLLGELSPRLVWADSTLSVVGTRGEWSRDPGPVRRISAGPERLPRRLAALSESSTYTQYEDDPPPCDAPHQTPRAHPRRSTGQDLGGRGLVLVPSVFTWPEIIGGHEPPWQPAVIYPARGIGGLWTEAADRTPDALARLLGRARADVLCALDEPAGTTALAHRLGLAPSSVSAHLSVLRDAGLLTSRRHSHQVLYERTPLGIALAVS